MAQADLGKVRLTDAELLEKIILANGGVKFGKDADGKPGYVVVDAETGADTVIPFSSGGGGQKLPVIGSICFAGSNVNAVNGGVNYSVFDLFDEPIEISKISDIRVTININTWYRVGSGSTSGLMRNMFLMGYVMDENDKVSRVVYTTPLVNVNGTASIKETNKEIIIPLNTFSSYKKLAGIGCNFYVYGGGSSNTYWFTTMIGNYALPNESKMDYIIS